MLFVFFISSLLQGEVLFLILDHGVLENAITIYLPTNALSLFAR